MKSAICTLFEKTYHFGVGSLTNSLCDKGFKGEVYAGYKGDLPFWANGSYLNDDLGFEGVRSLKVSEDIHLHFIPLQTTYHLTNYKPDFMLDLLNGPAKDVDCLFYYDPDILQKISWNFMEQWVNAGVALSEDFNSPIHEFHPRRVYWRKYFAKFGHQLKYKNPIYVNGGFVGVQKINIDFLIIWKVLQENMAKETGSLANSIFKNRDKLYKKEYGDFYAFGTTDQDALNATVEVYDGPISFLGKEAMGFNAGFLVIPHALGKPKPWKDSLIKSWVFRGIKPSFITKLYWSNSAHPIKLYDNFQIKRKLVLIKIIGFLSRFYRA
ncbi:hypothetical protein A5893_14400 [Pedobacter psychrophilus]|uniref:Uncharacterized protein n=1 Tax=Pedobacter psychrophilus TaxID=1826909 RepID=A0A179DD22_9SPHI|nr:hypothetical protein [Pedobacter psychrophilus]OAQ38600.1 hypothetical protein A5893_14400 [Pedobacter psychrophilus]